MTPLKRRSVSSVALSLVLSLVAVTGPSAQADPAPDFSGIDRYVQSQVDANRFPGLAMAVVEGASVVHAQGFGHDGGGQPVTSQTPFMIGSNSKSFTALAIMQLVETGKLELDAPVQQYLPAFQLADAEASRQITLRQLLTHTSGLPTSAGGDIPFGVGDATPQDGLAALRAVDLEDTPGSTFRYSNAGYMVLGLVVEAAAQQPYAAYVQSHIFDPLQMRDTRLVSDGLVGYRYWFGVPLPFRMEYSSGSAIVPAGGVISTAEDMGKYLAMYLGQGRYGDQVLLSPAGVAELQRGVVHQSIQDGERTIEFDVAMGWIVGQVAGVPAIYHIGGSPNFSSWMVLLPEENRAVITLTNVNNFVPGPASTALKRIPIGIVALLAGTAPQTGTTMPAVYLAINIVLVLLLGVLLWSWVRLVRRPSLTPGWRTTIPLLWELGGSLLILLAFPRVYDSTSWRYVLDYTPDLGLSALIVAGVWMLTGVTRIVKLRRPARETTPRHVVSRRRTEAVAP